MSVEKLKSYIPFVDYLSKLLGNKTEIVLQSTQKDHEGVVYIVNNHVSGRQMGDPLTNMAIQWLNNKTYLDHNYIVGYTSKTTIHNEKIFSSTYFIKNEQNELIGMLCTNMATSHYKNLFTNFLSSFNIPLNAVFDEVALNIKNPHQHITESLDNSLAFTVKNVLNKYNVDPQKKKIPYNKKIDIIKELEQLGTFRIKGSVIQVSKILNISIPSIYRYINLLEQDSE